MRLFLFAVLIFSVSFVQAGDWPQWKGSARDNRSTETGLNTDWNRNPPPLIQSISGLGIGFSNLCFSGDRIFTMGDFDGRTCLIALDRKSCRMIWKKDIGEGGKVNGYVGPKATPAAGNQRVFGLNQKGILFCCDSESGKILWEKNLYEDFDGYLMKRGPKRDDDWGYAESPLLDGNRVVCCPGGEKGAVIALNAENGDLVWRARELKNRACYDSIVPMQSSLGRWYLTITEGDFAGIDPKSGKILWKVPFTGSPSLCCDAVCDGDYTCFSFAVKKGFFGYKIEKKEGQLVPRALYTLNETGNKHHGMIQDRGYVYAATDRGEFLCFDLKSGKLAWKNRRLRGSCVQTFFEGHLILRQERTGDLLLVEANPEKYVEKGKIRQPDRSDKNAWVYPVIADGRLFVRDQDRLFLYDLKIPAENKQEHGI
ncbi:MAG: PQQ-like beta-propeller repeat protein [Planctomycetia bacterium]|nr:PQQ-like beta-propeller repeat protein [Planctomycetia bacterium]